jgi:hypothetical protein
VAVVQDFLRATDLARYDPALQPEQVIQQALFCDSFFRHWRSRLLAWPPAQLMPLMTVRGEEVWQSAYEQGKGARSPWAVTWGQMAKHLAYPPVEVGKSEVYQS